MGNSPRKKVAECKIVSVSAELNREYMIDLGTTLKMDEKALNYFRHFSFVKIQLVVDLETGQVLEAYCNEKY